jgi:hypothetical protein
VTVPSGTAGTGLLHLLPELGYNLGEHASLSLQIRHQIITAEGDKGGRDGRPAPGAFAALLRYVYAFRDSTATVRPFVSGVLGGGEGFRLVLAPNKVEGQPGTDTVRGGPVVFGPGGGLRIRLGSSVAWLVEARSLIGVPDAAAVFDADTGIQVSF